MAGASASLLLVLSQDPSARGAFSEKRSDEREPGEPSVAGRLSKASQASWQTR